MGLNYDLGDKSENLRRMIHFEIFNKANEFFLQKMIVFFRAVCAYFGVKDRR